MKERKIHHNAYNCQQIRYFASVMKSRKRFGLPSGMENIRGEQAAALHHIGASGGMRDQSKYII